METEVKDLRKRRRFIAEQMERLTRPPFSIEKRAQFEVLDLAQQELRRKIEALDPGENVPSREARERAFRNYLRHGYNLNPERGDMGLSSEDKRMLQLVREARDMGEGTIAGGGGGAYPGSTGGAFAPLSFAQKVEAALRFHSDLWATSTVIPTATGTPFPYPISNDSSVSGEMISENALHNAADIGAPGQVVFNAFKFSSKIIKCSMELVMDAWAGFEDYLADQFAQRLARASTPKFTTGSGSAEPMGIITAATNSGITVIGDDNATSPDPTKQVGYNDLVNLESSVDVAYQRRGSWMMHSTTLQYIKTLRDKYGRPLWVGGLSANAPDTLLNHPVALNQSMDQLGAGKKPVLFGDLSKFAIRAAGPMTVLRLTERWVEYGQIGFLGLTRWDSELLDAGTSPVKYLQLHS